MQFIAIVQKVVMSAFPHLGSGARQGVVSSRYLGMLISTQYLHSTHWTHTCVVLLAGGWWRHSYSCQESFTTATTPPLVTWHLAGTVSQLQTPDPGPEATLGTTIWVSIHIHFILHIHHFASTLSIPLFVCSGNAGISVLTSTKKYI